MNYSIVVVNILIWLSTINVLIYFKLWTFNVTYAVFPLLDIYLNMQRNTPINMCITFILGLLHDACLQSNTFPEEFWFVPFIRGLEMSVFVRSLLVHPRSMWTAVCFSLLGHQFFDTRSFVDISEMIWLSLEIDVFVGFCKELDEYVWCVLITAKGEPSPCRIWSFSF